MPHVCPWWGGYFIDNWFRRWLHNPERISAPYVEPGMTVLDFGCGMGIFSIAMARMVGDDGQVIAVDVQQQMLDVLSKRAAKAGVAQRIRCHRCSVDSLDLDEPVDFALAFYSPHEVPDVRRLLEEIHGLSRPQGSFLVVEPVGHVTKSEFNRMMTLAEETGFRQADRPKFWLSHAAVLEK
jgi:ubiquinone/menaquinone biosynthesis C-methylase UbiE